MIIWWVFILEYPIDETRFSSCDTPPDPGEKQRVLSEISEMSPFLQHKIRMHIATTEREQGKQ